jgi:hypothetical protein
MAAAPVTRQRRAAAVQAVVRTDMGISWKERSYQLSAIGRQLSTVSILCWSFGAICELIAVAAGDWEPTAGEPPAAVSHHRLRIGK